MHPVLFTFHWLGRDFTFGTYGVLMICAFAVGLSVSWFQARRKGYDRKNLFNDIILVAAGGVAGAVLVGFILFLPERIAQGTWTEAPAFVSWGGLLGGFISVVIIGKVWKVSTLDLFDIGTPGCWLGLGIGRIGCFFAGCCFGIHTDSCIGVTFTNSIAPASAMKQPLVPTQLISAAFLLTAGVFYLLMSSRIKTRGLLFFISIVAYSLFRFTIEFWRNDPRLFIAYLSDGQAYALVMLILGLAGIIYTYKKKFTQQSTNPSQS